MTIPATTATDQPAVEPCPHCGTSARLHVAMGEVWYACSTVCQPMRDDGVTGRVAALAAWNRRAPRPSPDAGVEALAVALDMEADSVERNYADGPVSPGWLRDMAARVRALQPSARAAAAAAAAAAAEAEIAGIATRHYCNSLERFSRTECLGWEQQKVKDGRFGAAEFEAHAEANREMGRHQGMHEALRILAFRRREAGGE